MSSTICFCPSWQFPWAGVQTSCSYGKNKYKYNWINWLKIIHLIYFVYFAFYCDISTLIFVLLRLCRKFYNISSVLFRAHCIHPWFCPFRVNLVLSPVNIWVRIFSVSRKGGTLAVRFLAIHQITILYKLFICIYFST